MNEGALEVLLESLLNGGNTSQAIMNQEKRGQTELTRNQRLPKKGTEKREQWQALGVVFGDDYDDLFVNVTLPEGWQIVATDHSMWTTLQDAQGRTRAQIFYKAAFYDRSAHVSLNRRFSYGTQPENGYKDFNGDYDNVAWVCTVTDCGKEIWRTDPIMPVDEEGKRWYEIDKPLLMQGELWLGANYPDYKNPLAYWD